MSAAIELVDVSKIYRLFSNRTDQVLDSLGLNWIRLGRRKVIPTEFFALRDVSLNIAKGARIGVVGRNGAGKTTLLKLITQNFAPTSGTVSVHGQVQALMQTGLGFHPDFTGYENICASLQYNGLSISEYERAVEDVIDFVELGEFLHQPMQTYSLGMRARLQFATATAVRPEILIIDEILGAGDAYFTGKSAHRMERLAKSGCTLLLVSHSTQQVLQFCDDAIWIEKGQVVRSGAALEVVRAYEEFIQQMAHKSRVSPEKAAEEKISAQDLTTAQWQKERMLSMLESAASHRTSEDFEEAVSRWPGEPGLKITRVTVFDELNRPSSEIESGRPLSIEIELKAEISTIFNVRLVILLMTLEGVGVCRHLSEPMSFELASGGIHSIRLYYDETILASGEFIFSAAAFREYDPDNPAGARRYDLLSRSFRLKIRSRNQHEPGLFHHPAHWVSMRPDNVPPAHEIP